MRGSPNAAPLTADKVGLAFIDNYQDGLYPDVIFRIGESGNPKLAAQGRTVALKAEVGFGGRVRLRTQRPSLLAVFIP